MRKREFSSVKIKLLRRKKILQNIWASIKVNYLLVECEIIKKMFNYSMFVLCEVGLCRKLKNPPHHITYHDAIYHVFNSILYFTFISTKIQQQQKYPTNEKFLFEVLCVIQFPITQSFTLIKQPTCLNLTTNIIIVKWKQLRLQIKWDHRRLSLLILHTSHTLFLQCILISFLDGRVLNFIV